MTWEIKHGDWIDVLRTMEDESVQCCVTSPPYWGLRDYGVSGQLGLERKPDEYIAKMVEGFREVRRVLRADGTLWLNIGDSYNAHQGKRTVHDKAGYKQTTNRGSCEAASRSTPTMKAKDLVGIPWMLAFALRADGWYLRQDIIWAKPNPMPESVTDRCTKSHEYLFLLSKSARYYFNQEAILEPVSVNTHARLSQDVQAQIGSDRVPGNTNGNMKAVARAKVNGKYEGTAKQNGQKRLAQAREAFREATGLHDGYFGDNRNKRSVWTVTTQPYSEAHFATFPPKLVEPCILAGCPEGGTVLDPFNGAGTTGLVATRLHRNYIGIELNQEYIAMAERRITEDAPLFNTQEGIPT